MSYKTNDTKINHKVYSNERIEVFLTINGNKGQLKFQELNDGISDTVDFNLFNSFEIESELQWHMSERDKELLLNDSGYTLVWLGHYNAYVVIPKHIKTPTIFVPQPEVQHVIGRFGRNIKSICDSFELKYISVKEKKLA